MIEFLQIAFSFPTVVFTTLLGVVFVYWMVVIIGGLDMEGVNSGAEGAADGAFEGAADGALEGAADGALEAAADGALEGAADGALEGVADGVLEGAADGALEGAADGVVEGGGEGVVGASVSSAGMVAGLLAFLRVGKVPVTITLSLLTLWAWLFSFFGAFGIHRGGIAGLTLTLASIAVGVGGMLLAIPFAAWSVRPLERLFTVESTRVEGALIGKTCKVKSLRVDRGFGMAEYDDGAAGLLLQVRCPRENSLTKGNEALIVGYDRKEGTYQVEPLSPDGALLEKQPVRAPHRVAEPARTKPRS